MRPFSEWLYLYQPETRACSQRLPCSSWDAVSNQWVFDYDSYYRTYPQAAAAASANANAAAYNHAEVTAQASAYDYNGTGGSGMASGSGYSGQTGTDGKPKKFVAGPKDEEGNPIAGKLKKGETRATVLRKAAGKVWEDQTLLEWDPSECKDQRFSLRLS